MTRLTLFIFFFAPIVTFLRKVRTFPDATWRLLYDPTLTVIGTIKIYVGCKNNIANFIKSVWTYGIKKTELEIVRRIYDEIECSDPYGTAVQVFLDFCGLQWDWLITSEFFCIVKHDAIAPYLLCTFHHRRRISSWFTVVHHLLTLENNIYSRNV